MIPPDWWPGYCQLCCCRLLGWLRFTLWRKMAYSQAVNHPNTLLPDNNTTIHLINSVFSAHLPCDTTSFVPAHHFPCYSKQESSHSDICHNYCKTDDIIASSRGYNPGFLGYWGVFCCYQSLSSWAQQDQRGKKRAFQRPGKKAGGCWVRENRQGFVLLQ